MPRFFKIPRSCAPVLLFAITFWSPFVQGETIGHSAETMWYKMALESGKPLPELSLQLEFRGLSGEESASLIQEKWGGKIRKENFSERGEFEGFDITGEAKFKSVPSTRWTIEHPIKGKITLSRRFVDGRQEGLILETGKGPALEILRYQSALDALKSRNAVGSQENNNLSLSIREHIPLTADKALPKFLTDLAVNHSRPQHAQQWKTQIPGRISNAPILSTALDTCGCQGGESLTALEKGLIDGLAKAMKVSPPSSQDPAALRKWLNDLPRKELNRVLNAPEGLEIRNAAAQLSSNPVFRQIFPSPPTDDAIVRMRFGNDFELTKPLKTYIGLSSVTHEYGAIDHDAFVANVAGVSKEMLPALREAQTHGSANRPQLVRYLLSDPTKPLDPNLFDSFEWFIPSYRGVTLGVAAADKAGNYPLELEGETVVWHTRPFHDRTLLGKYNPGLLNNQLAIALTNNKLLEAKTFNKYAPGSIPETVGLDTIANPKAGLDAVIASLYKKFPGGWVLKAVKEQNTGLHLVSDKLDLKAELEGYRNSDFDKYEAQVREQMRGADDDAIVAKLQEHPNFRGWKIAQYLENPDITIAQKRETIVNEFRVEAIAGKVLGNGSTVDRHFYQFLDSGKPPKADPEVVAKIERFTQSVLDKLPPKLRTMPFAFDVALLKDGRMVIIETNAGPESGFLIDFPPSIKALHEFLANYPTLVRDGEISNEEFTPREQMKFLADRLREFELKPERQFKGYELLEDRIVVNFPKHEIDPTRFSARPKAGDCAAAMEGLNGG